MKPIALVLALMLIVCPMLTAPARADDGGGAGNATLLLLAVVGVVFLISAWHMDYGKNEPISQWPAKDDGVSLVLCDPVCPQTAAENEVGAGLGLSAAF